ncbi:MAG TPA: sigma-70 family RNA polymerase sigma factor [Candidatus Dormibacteraeota bacterium]|nr:sigma-70 family RNA polymerase sigma factor [Candidatus Dormibacteraeota bacterium]
MEQDGLRLLAPGGFPVGTPAIGGSPEVYVLEGALYTDWETIYQANVVKVYRLMFSRVGNRPDAEDLTSEVFVKSLPNLTLPSTVSQVHAYLNVAIRSVLADHWRRHYGAPQADIEVDNISRSFDLTPAADESDRAGRILALLPDRSRRILELRFLRGCSIKQAANEMGVSPGNAKILQYRALRLAAEVGERMLS